MMTDTNTKTLTEDQRTELNRLLDGSEVNPTRSLQKQGTTLGVGVSVWPSEEKGGCFDVLLTAYEPGVGRLSLEDVSVTIIGERATDQFIHVAHKTNRGDLSLKNLASDALYYLHIRAETAVSGGEPVILDLEMPSPVQRRQGTFPEEYDEEERYDGLAAKTYLPSPALDYATLAAATNEVADSDSEGQSYQFIPSAGGRMRASLQRVSEGKTLVAVETRDPALADVVVQFAFVDDTGLAQPFTNETGQEQRSGKLTLAKVPDEEDLWEGRCLVTLNLSRPCSFLFETL